MLRTHKIGELNEKLDGKTVKITGWVDTVREHGKVVFVDLRDRYGKIQTVITAKHSQFEDVKKLSRESCVLIEGKVGKRPKGTENKDIPTGGVELKIEKLEVLTNCERLPFEINEGGVSEDIRLKYRYLDLRSEKLKKNLLLRHKAVKFIRDFLDERDFLEVTTPILTKSTPEGARDYIVPSRNFPGKFYALPQSPQQYKQLLMVGGVDRYFQIAPCFRDEDARADRCPGEFYQLDLEMSFVTREDILSLIEELMIKMVEEVFPDKKITKKPFPRLTYEEVMKKYKTDKPDLP